MRDMLSLEMKMSLLSPKNSFCYTISCKIMEEDKDIEIVLHNRAIMEEVFVYKATMIHKKQKQECIIIDNQKEIALIVM